MRLIAALLAAIAVLFAIPVGAQAPGEAEMPPELVKLLDSLKPVSGKVVIPEAKATLDLGEDYIFYNPQDARTILVDLWGNPPENANGVLGMVMPKGSTPISDSWGAVVTFEDTGYISDEDAATTDYDALLAEMQEGTRNANTERTEAGYPAIELVGWAERPQYDAANHSVVWAQNLRFSDVPTNTLNYDVRTLGRYGVLSLNLVSTMEKLPEIRVAAKAFAAKATFDQGARYTDFDPATDATADYGIAGLIAAGAGVAAAKKLGLFGTIGVFLVKFLKPILIGLALFGAGIWQAFKSRLGFGKKDEEVYEEYAEGEAEQPPFDAAAGIVEPDAVAEPEPPAGETEGGAEHKDAG